MELLKLLNTRYSIAKGFSKKWHDEIKRNIDDFEAKGSGGKDGKTNGVYNRHLATSRYDITIPYIFATHESMTSSFFENMPDIVITGRTSTANKAEMLKAIYNYLVDVADLDEFLGNSAWWFFLIGMVKADVEYKQKISEYVPQLDANQQPMFDEVTGEPVTIPVYEYNDPIASVDNPLKIHFSPDSEFTIDAKKVPYYVKERLVDVDEIKETYDVEVDADESLEVDDVDDKDVQNDLKRAKVLYYYGTLPSSVKDDPKFKKLKLKWAFDTQYRIYYTKDKILLGETVKEKPCKLARLFASQNKFFGFGIGTTLHPFQEDMSVRRSQQLAYADRFAFPWLMLPNGLKVDQKALMDYQKRVPLAYTGEKPPEYLTPPQMPSTVADADNAMRGDAQFVSGTLDLSKGAQQTNTVKTATGQQLFAQSQDKRLNKARKAIAKYYREVVIQMFKLARDNWDDTKHITYQDDDGNDQEMEITQADLQDINFDTDIDFNLDSVSVNQDIMSQRWLGLLEQSANVPEAKQDKIFKKVLKESYKVPNPEAYVNTPEEMMAKQQGIPQDPNAVPQEPPMQEQAEVPPMDQSIGSQLAPQPQYAG